MALEPLTGVLNGIEANSQWQKQKQYRQILTHWPTIVGTAVARQSRPFRLQRTVLYVATATSAWAQTLTFERPQILTKVNAQLHLDLTDIRFSTSQWNRTPQPTPGLDQLQLQHLQEHPSWVAPSAGAASSARSPSSGMPMGYSAGTLTDSQQAFQQWAARIQHSTQSYPRCPACRCPAPVGELKRWGLCSLCIAKHW